MPDRRIQTTVYLLSRRQQKLVLNAGGQILSTSAWVGGFWQYSKAERQPSTSVIRGAPTNLRQAKAS
jgi:hypothetical protein